MAGVPSRYYYNPQPEDRELTYRSAMLPLGTYRNEDGTESPGFAWPGMINEPINALERLGSGGFSNPQDPAAQQDMTTLLLSLYGGNALNPLARVPKGSLASGAMREAQPKGITAWHGSPHDFDKFSTEHIGKGEGAQAYGHGLYFADSEAVAKTYQNSLSPDGLGVVARGRLRQHGGDLDKTIEYLRERAKGNEGSDAPFAVNNRQALAELEQARATGINPGHLYQVRINAEPEDFLDWDKPLSQQSERVRSILSQGAAGKAVTKSLSDQLDDLKSGKSIFKATPERIAEFSRGIETLTGEQIMKRLPFGEGSKALSDAGIKGIRYLDQGSRNKGEGSYNYAVFDDKLVDTLHKWRGDQQLYSDTGRPSLMGSALSSEQPNALERYYRNGFQTY